MYATVQGFCKMRPGGARQYLAAPWSWNILFFPYDFKVAFLDINLRIWPGKTVFGTLPKKRGGTKILIFISVNFFVGVKKSFFPRRDVLRFVAMPLSLANSLFCNASLQIFLWYLLLPNVALYFRYIARKTGIQTSR